MTTTPACTTATTSKYGSRNTRRNQIRERAKGNDDKGKDESDDDEEKDKPEVGKAAEPPFRTWGESAKMAAERLTTHMETRKLDWEEIEEVTMESAQLNFLSYLASLVQGTANATFSYECHSDDNNISLLVRNRSTEQWMAEHRSIERISNIAGVTAGDAKAVISSHDNTPEAIRGRLSALDNSHDIQLTATFKIKKENSET